MSMVSEMARVDFLKQTGVSGVRALHDGNRYKLGEVCVPHSLWSGNVS